MNPPVTPGRPPGGRPGPSLRDRFRHYWARHRTLFWTLHSIWALANGGVLIYLAHEQYGIVPWVILFLILTWVSTLVFSRTVVAYDGPVDHAAPPKLHREVVSYLTRMMYQETLFFTLPFYWYSTVLRSSNIVFSILLAGLAVLSCIDLPFDRWLRTRPLFGLVYFATVAFAAINLLLPILLPLDPAIGTPLAAVVAVAGAIALAVRGSLTGRSGAIWVGLFATSFLVFVVGFPQMIPPVPLRLKTASFTSHIDRTTLAVADSLVSDVSSEELQGGMFILVEVFAPFDLPTSVSLQWKRNGEEFRSSREIEILAHELGFRIWDGFQSEAGEIRPGRYEVVCRTAGNRVFGVAEINVGANRESSR